MEYNHNFVRKTFRKLKKFQHIIYKETNIQTTLKPTRNIVICNAGLVNGLSEEILFEQFQKYGDLENILLLPGKSCCFISYRDIDSSEKAYNSFNGKLNIAQDNKPIYMLYCENLPENIVSSKVWSEFPPGLVIIENFITAEEEDMLVKLCNFEHTESVLDKMKNRLVQHFGFEFKYDINNVDRNKPLENKIPEPCRLLLKNLEGTPFSTFVPDQLTVNCYKPGHGIPAHIDTHSAFEDPIISLSLLSTVIMEFKKDQKTLCVKLPQRSMTIMSGESRYAWSHGITPRKFDIVATKKGLSTFLRNTRISFTFRKILYGPCLCIYKNVCDSQTKESEIKNDIASKLEKLHVHDVYDNIATHFSDTRNKSWPNVANFIELLPLGSLLLDIGCGNGKYLSPTKNNFRIGCDTSFGLLDVCRVRGFEVVVGNCLNIPVRDNFADGVICIAVIHHLGNEERRISALKEILRILKIGGSALIYVWAMDQFKGKQKTSYIKQDRKHRNEQEIIKCEDDQFEEILFPDKVILPIHVNRTQFKHKDVLVPWKLKDINSENSENTFLRYYHVFEENELEYLCSKIENVVIVKSYYDQGNWCILIKKNKDNM